MIRITNMMEKGYYRLVICALLSYLQIGTANDVRGLENSPITETWATVGGHVLLPCNMDPPIANDSTHLVLFYYGDAGTPIYSLDSRGSRLESATHWADNSIISRAFVRTDKGRRGLLLEKVTLRDQGHYRCRVDFLESPTRNSRIKLTVVIPPQKVQITSSLNPGHEVEGVIGPYTLGTEITFTCKSIGGSPRPSVSWYEGDTLVDNISEVMSGHMTINEMYQPPLTRYDFNRTLKCTASNSDLVKPISSSVTIDMIYPPTSVLLEDGAPQLIVKEGVAKRISCEAKGSRPVSKITWRMDDKRLHYTEGEMEEETLKGGGSRSVFMLIPVVENNGQSLDCSTYNPLLPQVVLRNVTTLSVLYKPRMELRPDTTLEIGDLKEGVDVTLKCVVDANPLVTGVQWAHNGVPIQAGRGHVMTQGTLTLRQISRYSSGSYTCAAANTEGATTSNIINLDVKFPPVCAHGQQTIFGAARREELQVSCHVTAYPKPTSFKWAVNNTSGMVDLPKDLISKSGSISTLRYTIDDDVGFGQLLCWGINDVKTQEEPCVFEIIPAAKPEAVTDCVADRNSSMPLGYVVVECDEGWGGGLNQSFTLEVRQRANEQVLEKFSLETKPTFVISGLKLGVPYLLTITAANSRGSSPPVTLSYTAPEESALSSADMVVSSSSYEEDDDDTIISFTPLILVLVGVFLGVSSCVGVGFLVAKKGWLSRTAHMKKGYSVSMPDLDETLDLPTIIYLNKDEILRESSSNRVSPISDAYETPDKFLSNSMASLDNELYMSHHYCVPEGKAPLAETDSMEGFSLAASSIRISPTASSNKMYSRPPSRSPSRPVSYKSYSSFPLNPDYLMQEEFLRKGHYLARSNYLGGDNYLPQGGGGNYLMAHHYLAKSENVLKDTCLRQDFIDPFGLSSEPPMATATLHRFHPRIPPPM